RWPRRPLDLPEGYHTAPRRRSWRGRPAVSSRAAHERPRGRAAPGRRDGAQQAGEPGLRDGNHDGNPSRRVRSPVNGGGRLTSGTAALTTTPLHLESKCTPSPGGQRLRDGRSPTPRRPPKG